MQHINHAKYNCLQIIPHTEINKHIRKLASLDFPFNVKFWGLQKHLFLLWQFMYMQSHQNSLTCLICSKLSVRSSWTLLFTPDWVSLIVLWFEYISLIHMVKLNCHYNRKYYVSSQGKDAINNPTQLWRLWTTTLVSMRRYTSKCAVVVLTFWWNQQLSNWT